MIKHEPFKIPIWEFELDIDNDILDKYCLQFSKEIPSVTKSNLGGYQSSKLPLNTQLLVQSSTVSAVEQYFGVQYIESAVNGG